LRDAGVGIPSASDGSTRGILNAGGGEGRDLVRSYPALDPAVAPFVSATVGPCHHLGRPLSGHAMEGG